MKSQRDSALEPRVVRRATLGQSYSYVTTPTGLRQKRSGFRPVPADAIPLGIESFFGFGAQGSSAGAGTTLGWRTQSRRDWRTSGSNKSTLSLNEIPKGFCPPAPSRPQSNPRSREVMPSPDQAILRWGKGAYGDALWQTRFWRVRSGLFLA
jgi:hypothetical protein